MKKYIAMILSVLMLCSCAKEGTEVAESGTAPIETTFITEAGTPVPTETAEASAETTQTEVSEVTSAKEETPETRRLYFSSDVDYREEYLLTRYSLFLNGAPLQESFYEYDEAGNLKHRSGSYGEVYYNYDYSLDGTYNSVHLNSDGSTYIYSDEIFYDENGYVLKDDYSEYTYESDEKGRLTKRASRLETVTYEYDSVGRLKTKTDFFQSDHSTHEECYRYEYSDDTMTIYLSIDGRPEHLSRQFTYDANGNEIKAVLDMSEFSDAQRIIESEYDGENRLLKRTESVAGDFDFADISLDMERTYQYDGDRLVKETINNLKSGGVTVIEYFYDGDRIIKEILTYEGETNVVTDEIPGTYLTEYIYSDKSYLKRVHNADGSIDYEQEYTAVNVIDTGIEYCENFNSAEPEIIPEKGKILHEYTDRNGYTFYCTKDTLYVKKGYFDIGAMDITKEQTWNFSYPYNWLQPDFYTEAMPPAAALLKYGLTYDVYFVIDGEFRKAEWYLNGEKLDGIDYTLLKCYFDGDKFTAYSDWNYDYDKNGLISLLKHTFEFDRDSLCFNGVTEAAHVSEGTAAEVMARYDDFFCSFYGAADEHQQDGLHKISAEGYRTRSELMKTLSDFCTDSAAEKICSYLLDGKYTDFKEINGQLYLYEGPPNNYNSIKYLHSAKEKDGVINAVFYSYTAVQDVPYPIEFFTAEFVFDNGVWKISDIDL